MGRPPFLTIRHGSTVTCVHDEKFAGQWIQHLTAQPALLGDSLAERLLAVEAALKLQLATGTSHLQAVEISPQSFGLSADSRTAVKKIRRRRNAALHSMGSTPAIKSRQVECAPSTAPSAMSMANAAGRDDGDSTPADQDGGSGPDGNSDFATTHAAAGSDVTVHGHDAESDLDGKASTLQADSEGVVHHCNHHGRPYTCHSPLTRCGGFCKSVESACCDGLSNVSFQCAPIAGGNECCGGGCRSPGGSSYLGNNNVEYPVAPGTQCEDALTLECAKRSPVDPGGHPLGTIEECAQPGNDTENKIQALIRAGADEVLLRNLDHSLMDELWQQLRRRNGCNDG